MLDDHGDSSERDQEVVGVHPLRDSEQTPESQVVHAVYEDAVVNDVRVVFQPRHLSREELREGCRQAERRVYSRLGTLRRLIRARPRQAPVWMANYIYSSRIAKRHDLVPVGEEYDGLEQSELPSLSC